MFVVNQIFGSGGDNLFLFLLITPFIFVIASLLHSGLLSSLFATIAKSKFMGVVFFLLYLGLTVFLCIGMTKFLNAHAINDKYSAYLVFFGLAISGLNSFSNALLMDGDDWEDWIGEREDVFNTTLFWSFGVYLVALFFHPIAVAVIYVIVRVVLVFVSDDY